MLNKAIAFCVVLAAVQFSTVSVSTAEAAGPLARMRAANQRSSNVYASPTSRSTPSVSRTYGGAASGAARNRLPAGRSYYQGRYYGHLNNRFYGPQYGYF